MWFRANVEQKTETGSRKSLVWGVNLDTGLRDHVYHDVNTRDFDEFGPTTEDAEILSELGFGLNTQGENLDDAHAVKRDELSPLHFFFLDSNENPPTGSLNRNTSSGLQSPVDATLRDSTLGVSSLSTSPPQRWRGIFTCKQPWIESRQTLTTGGTTTNTKPRSLLHCVPLAPKLQNPTNALPPTILEDSTSPTPPVYKKSPAVSVKESRPQRKRKKGPKYSRLKQTKSRRLEISSHELPLLAMKPTGKKKKCKKVAPPIELDFLQMDHWQRTLNEFLRSPSRALNISTGQPLYHNKMLIWMRKKVKAQNAADKSQLCSASKSPIEGNPPFGQATLPAIRLDNAGTALVFDNPKVNEKMSNWISTNRLAYQQCKNEVPPPFHESNDVQKQGMLDKKTNKKVTATTADCKTSFEMDSPHTDDRYNYVHRRFQFNLLQMIGIDLDILPDSKTEQRNY